MNHTVRTLVIFYKDHTIIIQLQSYNYHTIVQSKCLTYFNYLSTLSIVTDNLHNIQVCHLRGA